MIIYFSATGNSKYVASKIAKEIDDSILSIEDIIKNDSYDIIVKNNEYLGIVIPTYFWGVPSIIKEFLPKINFTLSNNYKFFVGTYGTAVGQSSKITEILLKNQNIKFNAKYSVKMPDTWTPMFDLSNITKVKNINDIAEIQIQEIISKIKEKKNGDFQKNKIPKIMVDVFYSTYESARKTKHLQVNQNCIGCSLCAKNCPAQAIKIENGKPIWIKEKCVMCLRCLHNCPRFAIQYENKTQNHGQYKK